MTAPGIDFTWFYMRMWDKKTKRTIYVSEEFIIYITMATKVVANYCDILGCCHKIITGRECGSLKHILKTSFMN